MGECICLPAIAGISDGPAVGCPQHGIGNIGGCVYCCGSGVITDYEGDRPCSNCDGTGTPRPHGAITPPAEDVREALGAIVKRISQKFAGPSLAEFANDPPTRKHYATADAILAAFEVRPHGTVINAPQRADGSAT